MPSARKQASSSGRRRAGGPPARSGFGATPANPQAELAEAERLGAGHSLLDAQERLAAIGTVLGRTPRFHLIQGYVCFQLGQLDRALALLQPLTERQDGIAPVVCTFLADACHHAGDDAALGQLLPGHPGWAATPEGRLSAARLSSATDPEAAVVALRPLAAIRPTGVLGWVSSLDHIRVVVSTHLALVSLALERLQFNHRVICYETLVAQLEASLRGCLDAMHLPMHEGVLHPERNPRIPITLSHSQAREPIYSTSVGRWQHYDWLFGNEWEQLVTQGSA